MFLCRNMLPTCFYVGTSWQHFSNVATCSATCFIAKLRPNRSREVERKLTTILLEAPSFGFTRAVLSPEIINWVSINSIEIRTWKDVNFSQSRIIIFQPKITDTRNHASLKNSQRTSQILFFWNLHFISLNKIKENKLRPKPPQLLRF